MVADVLTVLSFSVLIVNKVIPVSSQNVGCVLSIKKCCCCKVSDSSFFSLFL